MFQAPKLPSRAAWDPTDITGHWLVAKDSAMPLRCSCTNWKLANTASTNGGQDGQDGRDGQETGLPIAHRRAELFAKKSELAI